MALGSTVSCIAGIDAALWGSVQHLRRVFNPTIAESEDWTPEHRQCSQNAICSGGAETLEFKAGVASPGNHFGASLIPALDVGFDGDLLSCFVGLVAAHNTFNPDEDCQVLQRRR
jgi:hypothetical protein